MARCWYQYRCHLVLVIQILPLILVLCQIILCKFSMTAHVHAIIGTQQVLELCALALPCVLNSPSKNTLAIQDIGAESMTVCVFLAVKTLYTHNHIPCRPNISQTGLVLSHTYCLYATVAPIIQAMLMQVICSTRLAKSASPAPCKCLYQVVKATVTEVLCSQTMLIPSHSSQISAQWPMGFQQISSQRQQSLLKFPASLDSISSLSVAEPGSHHAASQAEERTARCSCDPN